VRARHPGVRDRGRAARKHARVGRLHVRVRADHCGDAPVEPARQRHFLARRLGVEVDDDDRRLSAGVLDELVDDLERRLGDLEEQPTH